MTTELFLTGLAAVVLVAALIMAQSTRWTSDEDTKNNKSKSYRHRRRQRDENGRSDNR